MMDDEEKAVELYGASVRGSWICTQGDIVRYVTIYVRWTLQAGHVRIR